MSVFRNGIFMDWPVPGQCSVDIDVWIASQNSVALLSTTHAGVHGVLAMAVERIWPLQPPRPLPKPGAAVLAGLHARPRGLTGTASGFRGIPMAPLGDGRGLCHPTRQWWKPT